MNNDGWVTREGLCALVGVTGRKNVQEWERAGMPFVERTGRRGGKKPHFYLAKPALRWLVDHASLRISQQAETVLRDMEGGGPSKETGAAVSPSSDGGPSAAGENTAPGLDGAFERMKQGELSFSAKMHAALADGNIAVAVACAKQVAVFAEGMAKIETFIRERDIAAGKLVNAAEMTSAHLKILVAVKNNLLAVPSSSIPQLMPLMRNPNDAPRVQAILERLVKDALRTVAQMPRETFC